MDDSTGLSSWGPFSNIEKEAAIIQRTGEKEKGK